MNDTVDFWDVDSVAYQTEKHIEPPPTVDMIASIEAELGYKLPTSYIQLTQNRNGGIPNRTCFPTSEQNSWAEDHIAITSLFGIGRNKTYSLLGDLGSRFMIEEWEYPQIGVYFADCPSGGHDMVALDYRECGPQGEPCVVHVDQEDDFRIIFLAPDFSAFIAGLVSEDTFADKDGEDDAQQ